MSDSPQNIPVGNDHYEALGKMTVSWAFFELIIDMKIWELSGIDSDLGACITSQIAGPGRKLDALISIIRHRIGEGMTKKLNSFHQHALGLAERRNRMIHDPLMKLEGEDHPRRIEITAKRRLRVETEPQTVREILELGREIHQHASKFEALMDEVNVAIEKLA